MELEDCTTVKDCLTWAEGEWPGFWDFATLAPMSHDDLVKTKTMLEGLNNNETFNKFLLVFKEVALNDKSPDGQYYIQKSAESYSTLNRRLHEYKKFKG